MRHIEALVEDSSGGKVLSGLLDSILQSREASWTYSIRRHRGVGKLPRDWDARPERMASGLLALLPAKLRAYEKNYDPDQRDVVLVVMDTDFRDPDDYYRDLMNLRRKYAGDMPVVIGLAIEELEAWLLGDREALLMAYPNADTSILDAYEQDSVVGTWEVLARAVLGNRAERLITAGYPAVGTYKHRFAENIAPYLDAGRNVSPSFQSFRRYLNQILDELESAG